MTLSNWLIGLAVFCVLDSIAMLIFDAMISIDQAVRSIGRTYP